MTRPVVVFPSITEAWVAHLRERFEDLNEPAEAHERIPNPRPDKFVTVVNIGGNRRDLVTDDVTVTVEAWAQNDADALALAQLTRALLHATAGSATEGVKVYRVEEFSGPGNLPDDESHQARFVFTLSVSIRGAEL